MKPPASTASEDALKHKDAATARVEGLAALGAFVSARQCLEALEHLHAAPNDYIRAILFSGLIVNYARAFEAATDKARGINRHFSTRGVEGFDKTTHSALLRLRDEYIAHAGHKPNDYDMLFVTLQLYRQENGKQRDDSEPEALAFLGTRAQASLSVGPASEAGHKQLQVHLRALQAAAAGRLVASIQEHQAAMVVRYNETGQIGDGPTKLLGEGSVTGEQLAKGLEINKSDVLASFPVNIAEFPLAFLSLHYHLIPAEEGMVLLEESLQRKGGEWLGPVTVPAMKIDDEADSATDSPPTSVTSTPASPT